MMPVLQRSCSSLTPLLRAIYQAPSEGAARAALSHLAGTPLGQRHPPERVRDLVVELCQRRPWRADELALLLQRNPESIRQNYLRPLLAQKRIAMTLPDTPHSPQQAYRSVQESLS